MLFFSLFFKVKNKIDVQFRSYFEHFNGVSKKSRIFFQNPKWLNPNLTWFNQNLNIHRDDTSYTTKKYKKIFFFVFTFFLLLFCIFLLIFLLFFYFYYFVFTSFYFVFSIFFNFFSSFLFKFFFRKIQPGVGGVHHR